MPTARLRIWLFATLAIAAAIAQAATPINPFPEVNIYLNPN